MAKRKIEIIDIDLSMNLQDEIKKHTDGLDNLSSKKAEIIQNAKMRARPISKKEAETVTITNNMELVFKVLQKISGTTNPYLPMDKIVIEAGITISESDCIKIGTRLKNYISTSSDNKWVLDKKKIHGKTYYGVARFGG